MKKEDEKIKYDKSWVKCKSPIKNWMSIKFKVIHICLYITFK